MSIITIIKDIVQDYNQGNINKNTCCSQIFNALAESEINNKLKSRIIQNLPADVVCQNLEVLKMAYDL